MQCLFILAMITEARSQGDATLGPLRALRRAYTSVVAHINGLNGKANTQIPSLEDWDARLLAGAGVVAEQGML